MASPSKLTRMVLEIRPLLRKEIGEIQDDLKRVSRRLGRVPESLLQNGSREALQKSNASVEQAVDFLLVTLKELHRDHPLPEGDDGKKG